MDIETAAERALSDFPFNNEWISACCGAFCLGHFEESADRKSGWGICNDCHEHAEFVLEGEEEI